MSQNTISMGADRDAEIDPRLAAFEDAFAATGGKQREATWFASHVRCSPRTLNRIVLSARGLTAKAVIDERLALEAKRLLAYTDEPASHIAAELGFSEATNFTKFFARLTVEFSRPMDATIA